jgi:hypothetical protein
MMKSMKMFRNLLLNCRRYEYPENIKIHVQKHRKKKERGMEYVFLSTA